MKTSARAFAAFVCLVSFLACTSKVSVTSKTLQSETKKESIPTESAIQLLDNSAQSTEPTCTPKASLKFIVTQNQSRKIMCRDITKFATSLAVGPVCPQGVSVTSFPDSAPNWVPCDQMQVCTKAVASRNEVGGNGAVQIHQLMFNNLPWGCVGRIEYALEDEINNPEKVNKFDLSILPPQCPVCSATNSRTCEICGTDSTAPIFQDVITDIRVCNSTKVIVFAEDSGSGLAATAYSFDAGLTWQESNTKVIAGLQVSVAAGQIRVRDRAGNVATYAKAVAARSNCDCKFGDLLIANGASRDVYATNQVPCGSSCVKGTVTCNLGVLSGNTTFPSLSCNAPVCKCQTPTGQLLDTGQTAYLYKQNVIRCDQTITCAEPTNRIQIRCNNAETNNISIVEGNGPISSYPFSACSPQFCACEVRALGLQFKPSDGEVYVYKNGTMAAPNTCLQTSNFGKLRCQNLNSVFSIVEVTPGALNTSVYKYSKCTDTQAPTNVGTGMSDYDVGPGAGGGAGGGVGNGVGDGEGFKRRRRTSPGGPGGGCDLSLPPYYCTSVGAGLLGFGSWCYLPTKDGYDPLDTAKGKIENRISPGGYVAGFSVKQVTCGDSCSKYMGIIRCNSGVMNEKEKYMYSECKEVCP